MKSIYESGFLGDFDVEKLYYKVRTFYRGTKLYQNSSPNTKVKNAHLKCMVSVRYNLNNL